MKNLLLIPLLIFSTIQLAGQKLKPIAYQDGTQKLNGLVTSNAGKKLPGVLILPAWKGIDDEAKNAATGLEKQGYVVFIADIYGEGNIPTDNGAASKIAGMYKQDYKAYQQRISVALEELKKQGANTEKIAVIGYCFGGTGALETARAGFPVAGVISIHGGLAKGSDRLNVPITTKVLVEHPADDESVKPEDMTNLIAELKAGKTDFQIITYANSKHTFTNPESPDYNETMTKRAWNHTLTFLKEILK